MSGSAIHVKGPGLQIVLVEKSIDRSLKIDGQRNRDRRQLAGSVGVECATAETSHQFRDVLAVIGRATAVGCELRRRHCDLFGGKGQHLSRRCLFDIEATIPRSSISLKGGCACDLRKVVARLSEVFA